VARIPEQHAKSFLARHSIPVPRGEVARSPRDAVRATGRLGCRVVLKALVAQNRRAKAGGVRFPADEQEIESAAAELLATSFAGSSVDAVLVEERLDLDRELFLSLVVDKDRQAPVALASMSGGVDVEEVQAREPDSMQAATLDPWGRDLGHRLRTLWSSLGLGGADLREVVELSTSAAGAFLSCDATILELNPIGLVRGEDGARRAVAVGVVLDIDDQALSRQQELAALADTGADQPRPPTDLERRALEIAAIEPYRGTARFIELEGDVGLLVGGGGGSLVFFEAVRRAGARPACYTELGGNPSAEKVRGLTRVVLSCPGIKGLLVGHNITNNTQVDLVAEGVVAALRDCGVDTRSFPVVAREVGTGDERGRVLFEEAGIDYLGEESTLEEAARRIVARVRSAEAVAP
jgi:succinyl-CoA synthetase beta subunit/citryl-CoA synthetase large subunit